MDGDFYIHCFLVDFTTYLSFSVVQTAYQFGHFSSSWFDLDLARRTTHETLNTSMLLHEWHHLTLFCPPPPSIPNLSSERGGKSDYIIKTSLKAQRTTENHKTQPANKEIRPVFMQLLLRFHQRREVDVSLFTTLNKTSKRASVWILLLCYH